MGIDMYQDENSYDGKNFFLPNDEFILIDNENIRIYFYPYSKSDEFNVQITDNKIKYRLNKKSVETEYSFTNERKDTLVFTMHFINKTFVKMYSRVTSINERKEIDYATLDELDEFGFNPSAVYHLFELDTFHREMWSGFSHLDSLGFEPYYHLQFINDWEITVNKSKAIPTSRSYKAIRFKIGEENHEFEIFHSEGTQALQIIPTSLCQCDSIVIPYLTVDWANRIRKDMKENAYKYR